MKKKEKEILDGISTKELRDLLWEREERELEVKYGTKREVELKIKELDNLDNKCHGNLFHVTVHDGCEGWEALVEIDRDADWYGNEEELVENHIVNFMIENDYYPEGNGGGIENITVEEICRYSRPFFRIYKGE